MASSLIAEALQSEPEFRTALSLCGAALRRMAGYELDPIIKQRMLDLGEREDRLSQAEHEELMSLVEFSERRTIEKLEADLALQRLGEIVPDVLMSNP